MIDGVGAISISRRTVMRLDAANLRDYASIHPTVIDLCCCPVVATA